MVVFIDILLNEFFYVYLHIIEELNTLFDIVEIQYIWIIEVNDYQPMILYLVLDVLIGQIDLVLEIYLFVHGIELISLIHHF